MTATPPAFTPIRDPLWPVRRSTPTEFFWATVLLQRSDKFPITSALNNLRGQFFTDYNLLSAGSVLIALPVLVVFFVLQKQFVAGLTLGSTKG